MKYLQMKEYSDQYSYSFEADYPQVATDDSTADAATNLCITTFITDTLDRFRAEAIARSVEKDEMKKVTVAAWDELSISHNISLYTPKLLSIEFEFMSYYAMGMHPNMHTRTLNFQLHPSLRLELKAVFKASSNYLKLLSQYCVADLHRQQPLRFHDTNERAKELMNKEDAWILSGAAPYYRNYKHFVFTRGGIRVFFDPYQVGSYAEGRYEVFVPLYILDPLLNESIKALLS